MNSEIFSLSKYNKTSRVIVYVDMETGQDKYTKRRIFSPFRCDWWYEV